MVRCTALVLVGLWGCFGDMKGCNLLQDGEAEVAWQEASGVDVWGMRQDAAAGWVAS